MNREDEICNLLSSIDEKLNLLIILQYQSVMQNDDSKEAQEFLRKYPVKELYNKIRRMK